MFVCLREVCGVIVVDFFFFFFLLLCSSNNDGNLSHFFMEIENINNQMDKIKNLLVKLHVVGVFAQKRLARGTLFNHPKAITLITT